MSKCSCMRCVFTFQGSYIFFKSFYPTDELTPKKSNWRYFCCHACIWMTNDFPQPFVLSDIPSGGWKLSMYFFLLKSHQRNFETLLLPINIYVLSYEESAYSAALNFQCWTTADWFSHWNKVQVLVASLWYARSASDTSCEAAGLMLQSAVQSHGYVLT